MQGNACNHGQRDPSTMHTANAGGFCNFTGRHSTLPWLMARQAMSARSTTVPHIPDSPPGPAILLLLACSLFGWHQREGPGNGIGGALASKVRKVLATCSGYTGPGNFAGLVTFCLADTVLYLMLPRQISPSLRTLSSLTHTPSQTIRRYTVSRLAHSHDLTCTRK